MNVSPRLRHRLVRILGPTVAVALLALAGVVLYRELRTHRPQDILAAARAIPVVELGLAALFTFGGYLALTGYDALAFVHSGHKLPYRKVAFAAFVGFAFSMNLGFAIVTGSAVRYRFYSAWGIPGSEVARIVVLCGVTYWVGFLALSGAAFILAPPDIPSVAHISRASFAAIGVVCVIVLALYLLASHRRGVLRLFGWELAMPRLAVSLGQVLISCADWVLAAAVLYVLLPSTGTPFTLFLSSFLGAQLVAVVSHVPGGVGVFEGSMMLLKPTDVDGASLLASLMIFRAIYYLAPFLLAILLLIAHELWRRVRGDRRASEVIPHVE